MRMAQTSQQQLEAKNQMNDAFKFIQKYSKMIFSLKLYTQAKF